MGPWFKRRTPDDRDLDDEIQFHLSEEARLRREAGLPAEEARVSARRVFGNTTLVRETTRDVWGRRVLATLAQDLRHGARLVGRYRVFAAFSILSLALGIGGTTAAFSLYDAVVLRKLPVRDPDTLVTFNIHQGVTGRTNSFMPYPQFAAMRLGSRTVDGIFARTMLPSVKVDVDGVPAAASGLAVSGDYHATLGVRPAMGRLLTPADDDGRAPAAVISDAYWRRRFGASPSILGQTITLDHVPFSVVGVEPRAFFGVTVGMAPDVTIPLQTLELLRPGMQTWQDASATWIQVMGRLRPAVSIEQASEELDAIFRHVGAGAAGTAADDSAGQFARATHVVVTPGATGGVSGVRDSYTRGLQLLLILFGGALCLASLNVAALMLSRYAARRDEIAIRLALGAPRGRIVRQLLTESSIIAAGGGILGLLIAWSGSALLLRLAGASARLVLIDTSPDRRVLAFATAVSAGSCVLFALLPAIRTTSASRVSSRAAVGGRRRPLVDRVLVVSQTALAFVFVACAGLFLHNLQALWTQQTGYDRRNVLMFSLDAGLPVSTYRRVLEEIRRAPGVSSATASAVRPVDGSMYLVGSIARIGDRTLADDQRIRVAFNHVAPGYFHTLRIPLIAGRDFEDPDASPVVIVSARMARHFAGNPVGQRVAARSGTYEVIGVAGDMRYATVKDAPREVLYFPLFQGESLHYPPTYELRYAGGTSEVLQSLRELVARVDAGLLLTRVNTLEDQTRDSLSRERLLATLTGFAGLFAWLLAGIGLYGLSAHTVNQRTREFGLRMALGAHPASIGWSVLRASAGTTLAGLVIGLATALMGLRLVRAAVTGVEPADPAALGGAALALLVLAGLASFVPARRASRVDPIGALRQD